MSVNDNQIVPIIVQSYMDWEGPAAVNAEERSMRKQKIFNFKETSTAISKAQGSYITKNEPKVVNLINLMQEFEHIFIREAASKVGMSKSTAARKIKEWNELTSNPNLGDIPATFTPKEHKGRKQILKDVHTVFIFELLANEPTLIVEAVTDRLCKSFTEIQITPRSVATHTKKSAVSLINVLYHNILHEIAKKPLSKDIMK